MSSPIEGWQAYAAGVIGLLVLIVTAVPKIFGPVGRWMEAWTDRRQRVARHTTAAEVLDLQTTVARLDASMTEMRRRATEHAEWDRKVYRELTRAGIDIDPPPVLF